MAQNIEIAGVQYNAVPAISVPKQGGGAALFADPSPTTAAAADVAAGKLFLSDQGVLTEGTGSGGGGGITQDQDGYLVLDSQGGGGSGPDLSNDTVTAATLLVGETAHDSSGTAITGTLTGLDLMPGTLVITAVNPTTAISIPRGVLGWNSTGKYLINSSKILPVGGSVNTYKIPIQHTLIAFAYKASNPLTFSDLSSGVSVFNNGDPIPISSTASVYIVNISGSSSLTRSFTVTGA